MVVFGHWLMYAPYMDAETGPQYGHLLALAPWSRWLTWGLQVMPVFFFVGGYSNGVSWEAAVRRGTGYRTWLAARLRRLLLPVVPLVVIWAVGVRVGAALGVPEELIRLGSESALVPTWFLSVYVVVVMLAPLGAAAWRTYRMGSFWVPALLAVLVDAAFFGADWRTLGWVNYLLVWPAVHQLGFAWREGLPRSQAWMWLISGAASLFLLTYLGPWPISLVGVPGQDISNTTPPHLPLLAVAVMQFGAVILLEPALNRWMARPRAWTATVLINGRIMTVFLWHSTSILLLSGCAALLGGVGLDVRQGGLEWWLLRVPWLASAVLLLIPLVAVFAAFERAPSGPPPPAWRMIVGSIIAGGAIARMAYVGLQGVGGDELAFLAVAMVGFTMALVRGRGDTAVASGS